MNQKLISIIALVVAVVAVGLHFYPKSNYLSSGNMFYNDLGSTLSVTSTSVTAGQLILSANSGRLYANIQNGAVASYLRFDTATTTNAIYLAANASYVINGDNLYTGNVYASSTAGASTFIVTYK